MKTGIAGGNLKFLQGRSNIVSRVVQLAAYVFGVELALAAGIGWIDGVEAAAAKWLLLLLSTGCVLWFARRLKPRPAPPNVLNAAPKQIAMKNRVWVLGLAVACISLVTSLSTAEKFDASPPCFHDEYAYLLQAKTFLQGRLWFTSHPTMPDLFDQMHILNEGKFASRYYPGTALWMVPSVCVAHPLFGHWFAGALISVFVFATGLELGGNLCGFTAGLVAALSPSMAIFSNLLLSSHPTMLGLSVFIFAFFRALDTESWRWTALSGIGLGFALLCRPLTAVGVAAPFIFALIMLTMSNGILCICRKHQRGNTSTLSTTLLVIAYRNRVGHISRLFWRGLGNRHRLHMTIAGLLPILGVLLVILLYNHVITGDSLKSPWELYNEIYTPRHAYGFNNGVRGDASQSPKVVKSYDRWADNLTLGRAWGHAGSRLVQSWRWTLGVIPLAMAAVVVLFYPGKLLAGWFLLGGIFGLHAAYFPYWYEGTLGFHYVFETIPLWALVFGLATTQLYRTWWSEHRYALFTWWMSLALVGPAAMYLPMHGKQAPVDTEIAQMTIRRTDYARFLSLVDDQLTHKPALVLIDQGLVDSFVVNSDGLDCAVIFGRYKPKIHTFAEISRAFPDRTIYLFDEGAWQVDRFIDRSQGIRAADH